MDVKYLITVDATGAQKSIQVFDDTLKGLPGSSDKAGKSIGDMVKGFALGEMVFTAARKAMSFLWGEIKALPAAAIEAEKAERALDSALEITGRNIPGLARHFKDYADALMSQTKYDDEAIKGAQALLVQLTNLDKNGIDRATKGAIGLASVFGMDLESAAQLVAKSMTGNTAMLSRYGIRVDETATKEQQRAQILEKLESFYGRATAETETYGGKLVQLKNTYGEIQEAAGKYLTQNTSIIRILNQVAEATLFLVTQGGRLKTQEQALADMEDRRISIIDKMFDATNLTRAQMKDVLAQYDWNYEAVMRSIRAGNHGIEMQTALKNALVSVRDAVHKETIEQDKLSKGTNKFADEVKKAIKPLKSYAEVLYDMPGSIKKVTNEQYNMLPGLNAIYKAEEKVGMGFDDMTGKIKKSTAEAIDGFINMADKVVSAFTTAYSFIDQISQQSFRNKEISMDNDYKRQAELISMSKMNETDKANAMAALDEEYDKKRQDLERKKAKQQKDSAIMNAVISTYQAAAQTYASFGFPWGLVPAAIVIGLGLALVAKIKAQPIPLAKGAIFNQPTVLPSLGGRSYEVAEPGSGGVEIVATPANIRKAIGLDRGGSGGNSAPINLTFPIYIAGTKVQTVLIKLMQDASQVGKLKITGKAIA